jgi:hypothetical protein
MMKDTTVLLYKKLYVLLLLLLFSLREIFGKNKKQRVQLATRVGTRKHYSKVSACASTSRIIKSLLVPPTASPLTRQHCLSSSTL